MWAKQAVCETGLGGEALYNECWMHVCGLSLLPKQFTVGVLN